MKQAEIMKDVEKDSDWKLRMKVSPHLNPEEKTKSKIEGHESSSRNDRRKADHWDEGTTLKNEHTVFFLMKPR